MTTHSIPWSFYYIIKFLYLIYYFYIPIHIYLNDTLVLMLEDIPKVETYRHTQIQL